MKRKRYSESKSPSAIFSSFGKISQFPTHNLSPVHHRMAKEQVKPLNGLLKVKKWIEDRGLKRAAVTNAPGPNAELMISLLGLSDFFHAVVLGSDCARAKPFPDPYLKALEILQVSKDHTFIFEVYFLHPIIVVFFLSHTSWDSESPSPPFFLRILYRGLKQGWQLECLLLV